MKQPNKLNVFVIKASGRSTRVSVFTALANSFVPFEHRPKVALLSSETAEWPTSKTSNNPCGNYIYIASLKCLHPTRFPVHSGEGEAAISQVEFPQILLFSLIETRTAFHLSRLYNPKLAISKENSVYYRECCKM